MLNIPPFIRHKIHMFLHPCLHPGHNVTRGNPSVRKMALTFDGDSQGKSVIDPLAAEAILDILHKRQVTCTFFLTGRFMRDYPGLTRAISEGGHEVGNHTYTHPHLGSIGAAEFKNELIRTEEEFVKVAGKGLAPYWRAPYGEYNRTLWKIAMRRGYTHIYWTTGRTIEESFDSRDWEDNPHSPIYISSKDILEHMLSSKDKNGAIALFHLGARKDDPVHRILPDLIDGLNMMQYRIVKISELS